MERLKSLLFVLCLFGALGFSLAPMVGCEEEGTFEEAGEEVDEGLEETEDEMDDLGDELEEGLDDGPGGGG